MDIIIAPSVLASNLADLASEVKSIYNPKSKCNWVHLDVMDGHFVPNLSIGPPVIKSLRSSLQNAEIYFDCHLMVSRPQDWLTAMKDAKVQQFTFHFEALNDQSKAIELAKNIKTLGMNVGLSIKPKTNLDQVTKILDSGLIHTLLIMTVEPGFGGQAFLESVMPKVVEARKAYPQLNIQVDGGINYETAEIASSYGANIFVAGTFIFREADRLGCIENLKIVCSYTNDFFFQKAQAAHKHKL